MTTLPIVEIRQIILAKSTLLDAILLSEEQDRSWITRAVVHDVRIVPAPQIKVVLTAVRDGAREATTVEFTPERIAVAIMRYCRQLKIPLPRQSTKSLETHGE